LAGGKDADALKALQAANGDINVGIGNIGSGKASANLSNINMLQAKIQFLQRTEDQMKKWGMDTKAIQSQIDALQAELAKAQQTTTP
jgi:ABC-type histidine transport system ATPase subunit